jgi:putative MATE family efflux protein
MRARLPALRHPHDKEILRLALPALGALVAEPLFLLADSAIVGRLGTAPLGGLSVAAAALTTLAYLCVFLAYGTTAAVARQLGAGDLREAIRQGIDGVWLAIGLGTLLLLAGWPLVGWLVDLLGASPTVHPYAATYLRISLLALPAMLTVLAGTGVLRGLQDTRTPLVVAVSANAVNLALNAWLVLGLHWGIAGSATGTVLAQYGSALAYLAVILQAARRHGVPLGADRAGIRAAATAGVALLVRTLTLRAVMLGVTAVAARIGDAEVAANQIALGVWALLALTLDSIAIAGQAITGRYLGAADVAGTRGATRRMVEWGVVAGMALSVLVLLARPLLPGLFSADVEVRRLLLDALVAVAVLQPVCGVVFVLDGVLIGAGDMRYLAVAGVGTMLAFAPAAYAVLALHRGLLALWAALGVFMLARLLTLTLRARGSAWLVTGALPRRLKPAG